MTEMTLDEVLIVFNSAIALFSAIYMLYHGIKTYSNHKPIRRIVYVLIGLVMLYHVGVYMLALSNVLPYAEMGVDNVEFTTLIRPIVSLYFLAPVALDLVQRKYGGLK
jgi:hypothetical protein